MLITESVAPSYAELRPLKPVTTDKFPVYKELVDALAATETHPDATIAHTLATCAGYAYAEADTVTMIMARMGLENNCCRKITQFVDPMLIASTAFLVQSQDGRAMILCYRGTEPVNLINWLTDVDLNPEKVSIALPAAPATFEVHGGFYRNVRATRHQVVAAIERALGGQSVLDHGGAMPGPLEALYITGHSLGGAMAVLMAIMLTTEPAYAPIAAKLKAVYTFGQPMVGTPELARACAEHPFLGTNVLRYLYGSDIAPQVPPTASGAFAHFGPEYQYKGRGDDARWEHNDLPTKQLSNLLELVTTPLSFLARQVPVFRNVPFRASIYDHLPHHYITALTPPGVRSEFGD